MRSVPRAPDRERLITLAILAFALVLRVWDLRARALWFDEASEFWVATAPLSGLIAAARTGTGDPPLFSFLLHVWMQAGSPEIWLRLMSVIASVAGVAGVMVLARRVSGTTVAWLAGLLMAVLPADIRYAQEVGQYGFVPAVVAWNLVFLHRMMHERSWRAVLGWTGTALAASYLYYGAALPIAACFLCVVVESVARRDMRTRRSAGTALVLYIAGLVPLLISYLPTQLARVVEGGGAGLPARGVEGIIREKWQMTCDLIAFQISGWPHTPTPSWLTVVPVLVLMALAVKRAPRLLIWFAVAINVYAATNALDVFPMGYRWGLIMTPLIICAIAVGAVAPRRRGLRWATIAAYSLLVGICLTSLPNRTLYDRVHPENTGTWPETEDMRVIAKYWSENRAPGQPTYVYYGAAPAFAYYTRDVVRRDDLPPTWCFACWHDETPPAYCRAGGVYYGRWLRSRNDAQKLESVIATLGGPPESLWLVFSHMVPQDDARMIAAFIRHGYRLEAAAQGVNASVCLLIRN